MPLVCSKNSFTASGADPATLASGAGIVYAVLASTDNAASQTFTVYDSLTTSGDVLFQMTCHPSGDINQVWFPSTMPLAFSAGLTVDPGNCDVFVIFKA
jgi:hypothetical protein